MKYYLHDSNARNDEKVTMLFIQFGYEGIGLFYTILEILASQEKPVSEVVLKSQLNIKKRLEKQLSFMYEIGILSVKNGDVFSENILNFSEKYQIKKQKTREKVSEWRSKQRDKENVTGYKEVRNRSKVKISKVKISKVNITETSSVYNQIKSHFIKRFYEVSETEYYFTAIDGKKIKTIIFKIKHAYKSTGVEKPTDEQIIYGFTHILQRALKDNWIHDNLSLANIDSQFNKLKIKKDGTNKKNSGADTEQIAATLEKHFGDLPN